jgi:phosphate transport system permease protein
MSTNTDTLTRPGLDPEFEKEMTRGSFSRSVEIGIVAGALGLGVLSWLPGGSVNWARWAVVSLLAYMVLTYVVARRIESQRQANDRLATAVMTSAFLVVLLPLISVVWTVIERGSNRFDTTFYSETMRGVFGDIPGGAYHAVIGTLIVTALAAILSVPFGLFTAIYLVEYSSEQSRFSKAVQALVDVMTGIPSIVAGLFAYAFFVFLDEVPVFGVLSTGVGTRSGLAGAVALTLLMTPIVIRASEEMLRLVPNELREASYALGVPKWKTIVKVVLPTAVAGILTGIVLAIARVIGETAPLLVTVGLAQGVNWNPFEGRMTTLSVFTYYQYVQPGVPPEVGQDRAWAAALTLMIIVGILFSIARILSTILKPKGLK